MSVFEDLKINELSSVEQEIYRCMVNNLEKIPYMRVREIANNAHVSSTSVFRFIKKIGYSSFPEFRFYIKDALTRGSDNLEEAEFSLQSRVDGLNMGIFDPDVEYQIKKVADQLGAADLSVIVGLGSSGAVAQYISRKLSGMGYFSIALNDMSFPIKSYLRRDSKNVVIFLSVSGQTKELIEIVSGIDNEMVSGKYCITHDKNSPLAKLCDYTIEYSIEEKRREIYLDLTSQLPAIAIMETILAYL